jgi:hypothetical protein
VLAHAPRHFLRIAELEVVRRLSHMPLMTTKHKAGSVFVAFGALIAVCSRQIVFPGLERLLGIEAIVGRESVVYQRDGFYIFTNPGAVTGWVASVAAFGVLLAFVGAVMLFGRSQDPR